MFRAEMKKREAVHQNTQHEDKWQVKAQWAEDMWDAHK